MSSRSVMRAARAFTLIEVLVVVAIIALLISILLPSLAAARETAKMTACQTGIRSLAVACIAWSSEHKGRLPGVRDQEVDGQKINWLSQGSAFPQPDSGAIWRHMGRQRKAYVCPSDEAFRFARPDTPVTHSYTLHSLVSYANTEWLRGAHRLRNAPYDGGGQSAVDHAGATNPVVPFDHVPMLVEEDFQYFHSANYWGNPSVAVPWDQRDGGWANDDGLADRHMNKGGKGSASIAFVDTHVGRVQLPRGDAGHLDGDSQLFFRAKDLCIRLPGKWISGLSCKKALNSPGQTQAIESAAAAVNVSGNVVNVKHFGEP